MPLESTAILDAALDAVVLIDERGAIVHLNAAAEAMFGCAGPDVEGRELASLFVPERYREGHRRALDKLRAGGEPSILGTRLAMSALRASGEEFPIELTVSPVEGIGAARFVGFVRDETRRRATETERDRLASIVASSTEAVSSFDLTGTITSWNAAAERLFGYPAAEAIGSHATMFVPAGRENRLAERISRLAGGEELPPYETIGVHRDGTTLNLEAKLSPIWAQDGSLAGVSAAVRDVGERRRAQEAIAHQARILAEVRDAVIETDVDFRIVSWNDAAETLYGWSRDEVVGMPVDDMLQTRFADADREPLVDRLARENHVRIEATQRTRSGAEIFVEASIAALRDDETGAPTGYVALNRDVTARRRLEDRLREGRELESIGRLAGGVAHDFNSLLTAMLGYGNLVLAEDGLPAGVRADVEEIVAVAERAATITRRLLAFGRRQLLAPRTVDLNAMLEDAAGQHARRVGDAIALELRLAADLPPVEVDPVQIEHVLEELVENAREAMPDGGQLVLETAAVAPGARLPAGLEPGGYVKLAVRDTGRGMDRETRERAFEPYFSTKPMGPGLGLATAHGIVNQSGGAIEVESRPGDGARLVVFLPLRAPDRL